MMACPINFFKANMKNWPQETNLNMQKKKKKKKRLLQIYWLPWQIVRKKSCFDTMHKLKHAYKQICLCHIIFYKLQVSSVFT